MSHEIITFPSQHVVATTTNFTVNVTVSNLDPDLTVKDFVVFASPSGTIIPLQNWTKTSRTVITYVGPALVAATTLTVSRTTELGRVQHTLQLGSTISSSILDAEILRIYKLIAEKLNALLISSQVNNVTRSTGTPSVPPAALGDEWHQIDTGGSGGGAVDTLRVWVGTSTAGLIDTNGWFEVTDAPPQPGNDGIAATVNVGSVTTGVAGSNAAVVNAGNTTAAVLNFTIPRGDPGDDGDAATVTLGTTITGAAASNVVITNTGTNVAAVLNFTIPRGNKGDTGSPGTVNAANGITFTHQVTPVDPGVDRTILYSKADGSPYYLATGDVERKLVNDTELQTKAPLTPAQDTITYGATVDLDLTALNGQLRTISLTGNLTLTASNQASQRSATLRLVSDATLRTLTFPVDWKFLGTKPADIAASKVGVLSLTFFGSTNADCVATWSVEL